MFFFMDNYIDEPVVEKILLESWHLSFLYLSSRQHTRNVTAFLF